MKRIARIVAVLMVSSVTGIAVHSDAHAAQICTKEYMPVCAVKQGVRMTYGNSCEARAAGAWTLHAGHCVAPSPSSICFEWYAPVCAVPAGKIYPRTYSNFCFAEVANARFLKDGTCR